MRPETTPMAMVTRPHVIEFIQREIPPLSCDEVLLDVGACAICGSDLHLYHDRHPFVSLPSAIGHEISGTVIETGEEVKRFKAGDSVVVEPVITCGRCEACLKGMYHLCEDISFHYRKGQGGFTRYFVARERWLHPVPAGVDLDLASLAEPLAVVIHAIDRAGIKAGDSVCIYGDGPIGLLLTAALSETLTDRVFVVGHRENRLELAREMGAALTLNSYTASPGEIRKRILEEPGGKGAAAAFEAVGKRDALQDILPLLAKGGTLVLLGLHPNTPVPVDVNLIIQGELTIKGSQGYCWDFPEALRLLKASQGRLRPLITHTFPLARLQEAFELLSQREEKTAKIIIHPA